MALPSVRRIALADVDEDVLRQLVAAGEGLHVEFKREPPAPPRFGAAAASFANMLGGFILLGIDDAGEPVGWEKPAKLDLQSHIGDLLRQQVDPLPPYVADMRELDGKPVAVVRVFESADTPHIVRGSGAIVYRTSKGKEPVPADDHETVLSMARRGEQAYRAAQRRAGLTPAVDEVFDLPGDLKLWRERQGVEIVALASPLTVTPALSEWPLTRAAAETCSALADDLLPPVGIDSGFQYERDGPELFPFGRAISVRVLQAGPGGSVDRAQVFADSGGVVAAGLTRGPLRSGDPPPVMLETVLGTELLPLVSALAHLLRAAEAYGRAALDLWVLLSEEAKLHGEHRKTERDLHVSRELTIPADEDEVREVALQWHRELQRTAGIAQFEREPPA